MTHKPLIIANWKMYLPYNNVYTYLKTHTQELDQLVQASNIQLVICPSAESVSLAHKYLQATHVKYGAQNCSEFSIGPYTGEISARSLRQIGCNYCLVGHHERRTFAHENNAIIAKKITQLLKENLIPIVCIGETEYDYKQSKTLDVISEQLTAIMPNYDTTQTMIIAYEPGWAIGTGIIPQAIELESIINFIKINVKNSGHQAHVLYGGSVNENTIQSLSRVSSCDGYLIGSASTDFKKLKNIVSLLCKYV